MDGVIFEVIVHGTLAETVVLVSVLNNGLLEEDGKIEYLESKTVIIFESTI